MRLIVLLLFCLFYRDVHGQDAIVESFMLLPYDITASTAPRMDGNQNACALIKVSLMSDNVCFSGDVVGDVKNIKNEYYVYMTSGSKFLKISGSNFMPLTIDFTKYGISKLEGKRVYQLYVIVVLPPIGQEMSYTKDKVFSVNGVSFKMKYIEGGAFTMGATIEQGKYYVDNDEKPCHKVTLANYMLGETEVTQALWKAVMGNNPSHYVGDKRPVERISWYDCQLFIKTINQLTGERFRLPTEAEWEYAARGGKYSQGYRYPGAEQAKATCWYGSTNKGTHDVGLKCPNEVGLYDMGGNVWEWCNDWKGSYSSIPQDNPKGPKAGVKKIVRGGSINSTKDLMRTTHRSSNTPDYCRSYIGFRLAL